MSHPNGVPPEGHPEQELVLRVVCRHCRHGLDIPSGRFNQTHACPHCQGEVIPSKTVADVEEFLAM